ncbi:hypothetical protein K7X08_011700 [Anisodus acutangulus]|uniref:Defensin-like protein 1 n=1 Tax=Anisodus acutangulus TaxID=402998 RepID=A0A9Q1MNZ1_9SOLA|nr:hypothetical protein K7X08_011700 [Anisodus acutangulus]
MVKSPVNYTAFLALLLCFLLISSNEMQVAEGKICRWRSQILWSSFCLLSGDCFKKCKQEYSKATKGECIRKGLYRYCYCFRNCK